MIDIQELRAVGCHTRPEDPCGCHTDERLDYLHAGVVSDCLAPWSHPPTIEWIAVRYRDQKWRLSYIESILNPIPDMSAIRNIRAQTSIRRIAAP